MCSDNWSRTALIRRLALASVCGLLLATAAAVGQEAKSADPKPTAPPPAVRAQAKPPVSPPSRPEDQHVRYYSLRYADGQMVLMAMPQVAPEAQAIIDSRGNRLIVIGSQATHDRVAEVIKTLDVPPDHDQSQVLQVYQLHHVDPESALRVLETTLPQSSHVRMSADEKNETIVVLGTLPVHIRVKELLQRLDIPPDPIRGIQIKVFGIVNADAATIAETVLDLFGGEDVKISVDPRTNTIVATGSERTLEVIEALLLRFDEDQSRTSAVQVRVVWLASGLPADAGAEPAEDLKSVLADLAAVGVTGLRQVGQAMINTMPGRPFQMTCLPDYEKGPAEMRFDGVFEERAGRPILDARISAKQIVTVPDPRIADPQDSRGKFGIKREELVELDTQIAASYGHYVVLGVTPVEKANSVFVVQVTPK